MFGYFTCVLVDMHMKDVVINAMYMKCVMYIEVTRCLYGVKGIILI